MTLAHRYQSRRAMLAHATCTEAAQSTLDHVKGRQDRVIHRRRYNAQLGDALTVLGTARPPLAVGVAHLLAWVCALTVRPERFDRERWIRRFGTD